MSSRKPSLGVILKWILKTDVGFGGVDWILLSMAGF
jgi:hypothetical protein